MQPAMAEAHLRQEEQWEAPGLTPSRAHEEHPSRQGWVALEAPLPAVEEDSAHPECEDSPVQGPSALREWAVDSVHREWAADSVPLEVDLHRAAVDSVHREWPADSAVAELAVTAADSRPEEVDL